MRYREIPGTGIRVSEVAFGAEPFASGWWGDDGDDDAVRLLHAAADRGITLFDAADRDGEGRAQHVLGRAFRGRRDRVVIATRVGYAWQEADPRRAGRPMPQDFRPEAIRQAVRASAERLGGVIDICELHHPPRRALADEGLTQVLDELVTEGTVRVFGAAIPEGARPGEGRRLIRQKRFPVLDVELGVVGHEPGAEIAGLAHAAGACVIARGAHCRGLLEGKYSRETTFPPGDPRADITREWLEEGLRRVGTLDFLHAEGRPWSLGQAAILWVLSRPGVASVVIPMHSEEQLSEFTRALDLPPLAEDDFSRIEALIASGFADEPVAEPHGDIAEAPEAATDGTGTDGTDPGEAETAGVAGSGEVDTAGGEPPPPSVVAGATAAA